MSSERSAIVMAGIPKTNLSLYHQIRFQVGDPTSFVQVESSTGTQRHLILRDIEMGRARQHAKVDHVHCPADFAPENGLSGDRETATAQATAELLKQTHVSSVRVDRSLPFIFAHEIMLTGIQISYDEELGVTNRRMKDSSEVEHLQHAQSTTETVMRLACETIARAALADDGTLINDDGPLTSESIRGLIDNWLLANDFENPRSIVACGPTGADCHDYGTGPISTGQPVIVDIFPKSRLSGYYGDCTRTVVHGSISPQLQLMNETVRAAKAAGISATQTGATGEDVHKATIARIHDGGFATGLPTDSDPDTYCAMTHGTGHGVGLEVHEPPLLDFNGPPLLKGDCLTIEPGLYCRAVGGVRVEDMVIVTDDGCRNLNSLYEGLEWNE
ncbi:MAG: M24 family metallopeptidase [Pirellulaceae bacterium]